MKQIIIIVSSLLLIFSSCKKCSNCHDNCCRRISTNERICSSQYGTNQYHHILDSLASDIVCSVNSESSFAYKVCNEQDVDAIKMLPGVSCVPIK
ncbi:MAG: hypothetical protein U0V74_09915 [Chitinophagales bacterium]